MNGKEGTLLYIFSQTFIHTHTHKYILYNNNGEPNLFNVRKCTQTVLLPLFLCIDLPLMTCYIWPLLMVFIDPI